MASAQDSRTSKPDEASSSRGAGRSAGRPSDLKEGELRDAIRRAAITLIGEQGFDGTSIQQIAERAGTTKPMVYYYFESKEGLLKDIIRDVHQQNFFQMQQILADTSASVRLRLARLLDMQRERMTTAPEILRFFHRVTMEPPAGLMKLMAHDQVQARYQELVLSLVRQGLASQELAGDELAITALLRSIFVYNMMLCVRAGPGGAQGCTDLSQQMLTHLLRGIRGPAGEE